VPGQIVGFQILHSALNFPFFLKISSFRFEILLLVLTATRVRVRGAVTSHCTVTFYLRLYSNRSEDRRCRADVTGRAGARHVAAGPCRRLVARRQLRPPWTLTGPNPVGTRRRWVPCRGLRACTGARRWSRTVARPRFPDLGWPGRVEVLTREVPYCSSSSISSSTPGQTILECVCFLRSKV
jgi:hypothetical protein